VADERAAGVEPLEDHDAAAQGRQRVLVAVEVGQGEVGRRVLRLLGGRLGRRAGGRVGGDRGRRLLRRGGGRGLGIGRAGGAAAGGGEREGRDEQGDVLHRGASSMRWSW